MRLLLPRTVWFCLTLIFSRFAFSGDNGFSFNGAMPSFSINGAGRIVLAYIVPENQLLQGNKVVIKTFSFPDWQGENTVVVYGVAGTIDSICNIVSDDASSMLIFSQYLPNPSPEDFYVVAQEINSDGSRGDAQTILKQSWEEASNNGFRSCGASYIFPPRNLIALMADLAFFDTQIDPLQARMPHLPLSPYSGLKGDILTLERNNTASDYQLCLRMENDRHCESLPEPLTPPYYMPLKAGYIDKSGHYHATSLVILDNTAHYYLLSDESGSLEFMPLESEVYSAPPSIPVMTLTANSRFIRNYSGNVVATFFIAQDAHGSVNLYARYLPLEQGIPPAAPTGNILPLALDSSDLPDPLTPGIVIEDQPASASEPVIHLFYVIKDSVWHFHTTGQGHLVQGSVTPLSDLANFTINSSATHVDGEKIVTLAGESEHSWRMVRLPLSRVIEKSDRLSWRNSLNSHAEGPFRLEIILDSELSAIEPYQWNLGYYGGKLSGALYLLINGESCTQPKPDANVYTTAYQVGNRLFFIALNDCYQKWLSDADTQKISLVLVHLNDQFKWVSAGKGFDILASGGFSADDFLWIPVNPQIVVTNYSTPRLKVNGTNLSGYRNLVVDSSKFDAYPADHTREIVGIIAGSGAGIALICGVIVAVKIYLKTNKRAGYDAL